MSKIKLTTPIIRQAELSDKPIIIVDAKDEKGYRTIRGFVPCGDIFISCYNQLIEALNEQANSGTEYLSIPGGFMDCFHDISLTEISDYIEQGILSEAMKEKISSNMDILPFRVGVYKDNIVLYFIGKEEELFIYDLLMIRQHDVRVRLCKDCGKAFIPKTNGQYCPHCRDILTRNKANYEKLKADPVRLKYTRLQQRIQKREPILSPYKKWFENLAIDNKTESWLNEMSELDKRYKSVKRDYISCGFSSAEKEWDEKFKQANLSTLDDLKVWLDDIANYRSDTI